jgi:hypothetical protein
MKTIFSKALIGIAILLCNHLFANGDAPEAPNNKASISGKVIDIKTGESLVGVAILVEGTDLKVYSDLDGTFTIKSLNPGNYNLVLSLISYKDSLVENLKLNPGEKEALDVKLDVLR